MQLQTWITETSLFISSIPCQPQPPISISPVDFPDPFLPAIPLSPIPPHMSNAGTHTQWGSLFHHLPYCVFSCFLLWEAGMPQTSGNNLILMTNEEKRAAWYCRHLYSNTKYTSAKTPSHTWAHIHTSCCITHTCITQWGNQFCSLILSL